MTSRKPYISDITDAQWAIIAPLIAQKPGKGRKRTVNMREVLNTLFYQNKTGCQWNMLPHDLLPAGHVWYYYHLWQHDGTWDRILTILRESVRLADMRDSEPSAAILDSQSVKTTGPGEDHGYDAGKHINGRKRHIIVDTMGLLLLVMVTAASVQDRDGAVQLCDELTIQAPRIKKVWADSAYSGELVTYVATWCHFVLEIVKKPVGQKGFQVHPMRWIVERTFAWLNQQRRLSKDYERTTLSSETAIKVAAIRLTLNRFEKHMYPLFA